MKHTLQAASAELSLKAKAEQAYTLSGNFIRYGGAMYFPNSNFRHL